MQNRLRVAILVAVFFGLMASYGIYNFLRQQRLASESLKSDTQDVVVAALEIPTGTIISPEMVKVIPYLQTSVPPGFFSSPDQVNGKAVQETVVAGEPLLASRLGAKAGLTMLLAPGQRAMAIKVDEIIGVSGFIAPNDRVDVIANVTPPGEDGQEGQMSKIVLQNKRVLSAAQGIEERKDGKAQVVSSITLELAPEEVEKLSIASLEGRILLALRGTEDVGIVATRGSTKNDLLAFVPRVDGGPPLLPDKYRVEVYQGSTKTVQEF